ncbi:MAG TPA: hypothetical protein PLB25_21460 [Rhodoferax sp.]|nr:hypothetical protein [Rhodoferax sp.]
MALAIAVIALQATITVAYQIPAEGIMQATEAHSIWILQLTVGFHLQVLMRIYFFGFDGFHPLHGSATHPIEPLATRLLSLLIPRPPGPHAGS